MSSTPYLAGISIYPIKSLDGVTVTRSTVLLGGALQHDREFALFDEKGFVNGKRYAKIHPLRSRFDRNSGILSLQIQGGDSQIFHIDKERSALEAWLSAYFGFPVHLKQNEAGGFPDDTNALGPTIVSTGTLETIASWFPELTVEEVRSRFRANLEIAGVPPFWEDQLFAAEADQTVSFRVGEVQFEGINPCQRCVVVTRDPQTGEVLSQFQRQFVTQRQATLPSWTARSRFNHFFRLAVNTSAPSSEVGKVVQVGDAIELMSS